MPDRRITQSSTGSDVGDPGADDRRAPARSLQSTTVNSVGGTHVGTGAQTDAATRTVGPTETGPPTVEDPRPEPRRLRTSPASANPPEDEYVARWNAVRRALDERDLDALLVSAPENIYYLTGLHHQGYFSFTLLIVPTDGEPMLVTRSMERVTITDQTPSLHHVGFDDHERPGHGASRGLDAAGLTGGHVAVEKDNMFFPIAVWDHLRSQQRQTAWTDGSGIVDQVRMIKSPWEIDRIRQAAALSDRGARAGTQVVGVGVNEREVAAAIYHSLVLGGSEYPGFAPLVRSTANLLHEHETWQDRVLTAGDGLLMELSASVARYHAPLTRLVYVGAPPDNFDTAAEMAIAGLNTITDTLAPGVVTGEVYAAWQDTIDEALGHDRYRRHHCGYTVGIGFPPSWVGGSTVVGIRPQGDIVVRQGMVFHLLSWLLGQEPPDYAVSDTAVVTADGCELLTCTSRGPIVIA